jgi:hypothetical protein
MGRSDVRMTVGETEQRFPSVPGGKSSGEQPVNDFARKLFTASRGEKVAQNNRFTFRRARRNFSPVP